MEINANLHQNAQSGFGKKPFSIGLFALIFLMSPMSQLTHADGPIDGAYDRLVEARKEYYKELKKYPNSTPEQRSLIEERVIGPAYKGVDRATKEGLDETFRRNHIVSVPPGSNKKQAPKNPGNNKFSKWREKVKTKKGTKPKDSNVPVGPMGKKPEEPTLKKPEERIDGKQFPKVLEFPGNPNRKPKFPAPQRTDRYKPQRQGGDPP